MKGNRAKYLRTLLRDKELTAAFNDLLVIYGLWDNGMILTTLHKLLTMRCREVSREIMLWYKLSLLTANIELSQIYKEILPRSGKGG